MPDTPSIDLSKLTLQDMAKLPPGLYYARTARQESAILKVGGHDPLVRLETLLNDGSVRVSELYRDGSQREFIR